MRIHRSLLSVFVPALMVLVGGIGVQAQSPTDQDSAAQPQRLSRFRFIEPEQESSSIVKAAQSAAPVVPEVQPVVRQRFAGPLDGQNQLAVPQSARPLASVAQVRQAEFSVMQKSPTPAAPVIDQVSAEKVLTYVEYAQPQTPQAPANVPTYAQPQPSTPFIQASTQSVAPQMTYFGAPRKAYYFDINEEDICDEWEAFSGCGGLKAYPGHWGIRCLTGCDACEKKPCDCCLCRHHPGCKKCAHCDPCDPNKDKCDRCRRRHDNTSYSLFATGPKSVVAHDGDCGCASCAKAETNKKSGGLLNLFR